MSGKTNADGLQLPIDMPRNINQMEIDLEDYWDRDFIKYVRFGWPLNATNTKCNSEVPHNQRGARVNKDAVRQYLREELKEGAIIGPFKENPFGPEARFCPLDTRPKKDSDELRIILNLSYPWEEGSVNENISKEAFQGQPMDQKYPSVDHLVKIIRKKGRNCKLMKRDLRKAFKQMHMDPGSIHLLGYSYDGWLFFDVMLSMGSGLATYCCQRVTSAVIFVIEKEGWDSLNYLDDLGAAETEDMAQIRFEVLGNILDRFGIWESKSKACAPSCIMVFLDFLLNTISMTVTITEER